MTVRNFDDRAGNRTSSLFENVGPPLHDRGCLLPEPRFRPLSLQAKDSEVGLAQRFALEITFAESITR